MDLSTSAVTSITNFILAGETFFLGGLYFARPKTPRSAAWYWQFTLLLLAGSALIGGIDHGFVEPLGQTPARNMVTYFNWLLIGLLTFCTLLCTAQQFFAPAWRRFALVVAFLQLVVYEIFVLIVDDFLVVIINYAPVLFLLLVCNLRGGRRTGSAAMTMGIPIAFAASGIQAGGVDLFSPLDRNGLYHLGLMIAVVYFYRGGLRLQGFIKQSD